DHRHHGRDLSITPGTTTAQPPTSRPYATRYRSDHLDEPPGGEELERPLREAQRIPDPASRADRTRDQRPAGNHARPGAGVQVPQDRKSTRLNSSHLGNSYAVFCLNKKNTKSVAA